MAQLPEPKKIKIGLDEVYVSDDGTYALIIVLKELIGELRKNRVR